MFFFTVSVSKIHFFNCISFHILQHQRKMSLLHGTKPYFSSTDKFVCCCVFCICFSASSSVTNVSRQIHRNRRLFYWIYYLFVHPVLLLQCYLRNDKKKLNEMKTDTPCRQSVRLHSDPNVCIVFSGSCVYVDIVIRQKRGKKQRKSGAKIQTNSQCMSKNDDDTFIFVEIYANTCEIQSVTHAKYETAQHTNKMHLSFWHTFILSQSSCSVVSALRSERFCLVCVWRQTANTLMDSGWKAFAIWLTATTILTVGNDNYRYVNNRRRRKTRPTNKVKRQSQNDEVRSNALFRSA